MSAQLTRAESQGRTRTTIVEAAERLFLRNGFRVTSLEDVGEEAGFTRGAVYSNFASKTELGIAVLDELYGREERRLGAALERASGREEWLDTLSRWAEETLGDPAWTRLELEIAASGIHDPDYRAATAARYERTRARWAEEIAARFGETIEIDAEAVAAAIVGLALGLGAQRAADPSLHGSLLGELVRPLLAATPSIVSSG